MSKFTGALAIGTLLQVLMVLIGHFVPAAQRAGLFPIAGTAIGALTGWLAATGAASAPAAASRGGVAAGIAGTLGSALSAALGDVPAGTIGIAGSTLVAGALAALLRRGLGQIPR
jgi:hypothetical protein